MEMFVRTFLAGIVIVSAAFICGNNPPKAYAAVSFDRTLTIGSRGENVRELQKILNQDPSTRIAGTGSGSAGQETAYFGPLTRDAVIRFQEKNANAVLLPNGLSAGTGIVGPSTRAFLVSIKEASPGSSSVVSVSATTSAASSATPAASAVSSGTASQNPNLKNLDIFLAAIDRVGTKQGLPAATLAVIKDQVTKDVATTTDLRAAFLKMIGNTSSPTALNDSLFDNILATIGRALDTVFKPERALAAGGTPFGGALVYPFFCNCSATWLITITPLPPTYVSLLTYVPGTQAFASSNIPATHWLLGEYAPGAGMCLIFVPDGCWYLPSEGMITPMVGSSPL